MRGISTWNGIKWQEFESDSSLFGIGPKYTGADSSNWSHPGSGKAIQARFVFFQSLVDRIVHHAGVYLSVNCEPRRSLMDFGSLPPNGGLITDKV